MDNFMDKLAKRFNAGEMIKANAQAEARDMKHLQERAAEYENMMQEMRRLNLKNVEMTEQVQQLIQCGIEQFEEYERTDAGMANVSDEVSRVVDGVRTDVATVSDNINGVKEDVANISGSVNAVKEDIVNVANAVNDISGMREDMAGIASSVNGVRNDVLTVGSSITTVTYQLGGLENSLNALNAIVQNGLNKGIDAEALSPIMESLQAVREILIATRTEVAENSKKLEEYVHKENVRVYRNVQAVVVDETNKKALEIQSQMAKLEGSLKKNGGLKAMVFFAMLAAIASVALQVAQMLGLL